MRHRLPYRSATNDDFAYQCGESAGTPVVGSVATEHGPEGRAAVVVRGGGQ